MKFPSSEFDDTINALCDGTASDSAIAEIHAQLSVNEAARDEYLWQVELHSQLATADCLEAATVSTSVNSEQKTTNRRRRRTSPGLVHWVLAAAVMAAISVSVYWMFRSSREPGIVQLADAGSEFPSEQQKPSTVQGKNRGAAPSLEGIYLPTVQFAAASDAPIIVGTGRSEPIELGAEIPYSESGHTLHIWDWSKSSKSRVMKDVRFWPSDEIAVSPNGKLLVWAKGDVLDLTNEDRSRIDLGGEYLLDNVRRIEQLQFAPDGHRLALRVSNLVVTKSDHPLRHNDVSTTQTYQIVGFPSGKLVCEFPAEMPSPLAFSTDGKRFVSAYSVGKAGQKIVERNGDTGEVIREYKPHLREYARAICFSNDGSRLAAFDSAGDALIWDTKTGELKHKVALAVNFEAYLRFSPDGKLLGCNWGGVPDFKIASIDVTTGAVVASNKSDGSGQIYWSPDSKSFRVVCTRRGLHEKADEAGNEGGRTPYNMFPLVLP